MKDISPKKLKQIYLNNSVEKACEILDLSPVTLLKYVKQAGIKPKGKGNRNPKSKLRINFED